MKFFATALLLACAGATAAPDVWQDDFGQSSCTLLTTGRNDYFVLEPGHQLVLAHGATRMEITVLNETRLVNGVSTRVVEEREWDKGQLTEVSRNYYAMCESSRDVLHFGEEVQVYAQGKPSSTDGSWLAGQDGNRPGLVMPGTPRLHMKYLQEIAPKVTLNRGEVLSLTETCKTPAGRYARCLKVRGTSGLDAKKLEYKYYAPGIGLVRDEKLRLVKLSPVAKGP
jgi:hypothetical protein